MKKKILGGIAILAIATVATFNVNLNLAQESNMSPLALANVEALAQNESGGGGNTRECWQGTLDVYSGVLKYDCRVSGCKTMRYQIITNTKSSTCTYYN
jgi:hypothetical protein